MRKFLLAAVVMVFLAGCGGSLHVGPIPEKKFTGGNDARIQQYLEENILDSKTAVCNFDWLNQPNGNVVEVWALCEEFGMNKAGELKKGKGVSLPVKITFANPTLHVIPLDGSEYMPSIQQNFSDLAQEKIVKEEYDTAALEAKNLERAQKWLGENKN